MEHGGTRTCSKRKQEEAHARVRTHGHEHNITDVSLREQLRDLSTAEVLQTLQFFGLKEGSEQQPKGQWSEGCDKEAKGWEDEVT